FTIITKRIHFFCIYEVLLSALNGSCRQRGKEKTPLYRTRWCFFLIIIFREDTSTLEIITHRAAGEVCFFYLKEKTCKTNFVKRGRVQLVAEGGVCFFYLEEDRQFFIL
ncbi:unnamed protein product, partial [Laminaria digitata]